MVNKASLSIWIDGDCWGVQFCTNIMGGSKALGELYLIPFSPWSRRVILTLRHCRPADVVVNTFHVFFTRIVLWLRGRVSAGTKVTAPALLPPNGAMAVMNSHMIAREVDARRAPGVSTLFPEAAGLDAQLRELVAAGETLGAFGRASMFAYLLDHPKLAARIFLPRAIASLPFGPALALMILRPFARKYAQESAAAGIEDVRRALKVVQSAINRSGSDGMYLVGGAISYADYVVALSLPFVEGRSSKWKDLPKHEIGDEFPIAREWGERFIAKHIQREHVKWPVPVFDKNGNVKNAQ